MNCSLDYNVLELKLGLIPFQLYCKLTKTHHNTHFRDKGRTDLVKLLKKARQKRKRASAADNTSGHKDASEETLQGAGALEPAVDGAAALSPGVGGAAALGPAEEGKEEVVKPRFEYGDEQELWWAQAGHISQLTQEASVARARKEQAEDIEVKNMRESFLLAEAMGVSGIEGANPYRPPDSPQTGQLAKFLEESIRKKESNLECPVCFEVTLIFWF